MSAANLSAVADALAPLGLSLPAEAEVVIELRRAALEAATTVAVDDLRAEVLAGRIAPTEIGDRVRATALALAVRDSARTVAKELEPAIDRLARQWARSHGDELIEALRTRFDPAAAALAKAVEVLGAHADPTTVLEQGKGAAAAWASARDAHGVLAAVRDARRKLARCGYGDGAESVAWWIAGATTSQELSRAAELLDRSRFDVEAVIAGGFALQLNTAYEAEQLLADAAAGSERERLARAASDPATIRHNRRQERLAAELARSAPA